MTISTRRQFLQASLTVTAGTATQAVASSGATSSQAIHVNHDLHTHTIYSDGASSIPLHVLEARAFDLDAVAITDHYTPGSKIHDSQA